MKCISSVAFQGRVWHFGKCFSAFLSWVRWEDGPPVYQPRDRQRMVRLTVLWHLCNIGRVLLPSALLTLSKPDLSDQSLPLILSLGGPDLSLTPTAANRQFPITGQDSCVSSSSLPGFLISLQSVSSASLVLCPATRFSFSLPPRERSCFIFHLCGWTFRFKWKLFDCVG